MKSLISSIAALALAFSFTARAASLQEITIGTTAGDFAEMAKDGLKPQLEKKGYKVKIVEFTDYVTPNLALASGQLDLNIFQHKPYLEEFSKAKGLDLAPVAQVPTAPLGLYAGKSKTLAEVKAGSSIALPNDPTNLARALSILKDLGWIELSKDVNPLLISTRNIVANAKNLKITQLEAAQLPRSLADVDYAIINGNYATSSGIPLASALVQEKGDTYLNWAVTTKKAVDTKLATDVREALQSEAFKAYAKKRFVGYRYPSNWK